MRALLPLLLLVCACNYTEERLGRLRSKAAVELGCNSKSLTLQEEEDRWIVRGCDRELSCDTVHQSWVCHERPTVVVRVHDLLSFQTDCPGERVRLLRADESERRYHFDVCDAHYVCAVSGGMLACKPFVEKPAD